MKKGFINILIYLLLPSFFISFFTTDIYSKKYVFLLLITYTLLTIYLLIVYKKELKKYLKNLNFKDLKISFLIFIIGFILLILSNYIINYIIIPNGISNNEQSNRDLLVNHKLIYSLILCILTPFIEEIVFRLEFKKSIKNSKLFIFTSSITFAIIHILSNTNLIELLYIIPYFILGLTFSTIYQKTDNILYSILFHIINNTLTVLIVLLF